MWQCAPRSGGTNFGLASSVVACTNSTMAFFVGPSFHEGSGPLCVMTCVAKARLAAIRSAKVQRRPMCDLMDFTALLPGSETGFVIDPLPTISSAGVAYV